MVEVLPIHTSAIILRTPFPAQLAFFPPHQCVVLSQICPTQVIRRGHSVRSLSLATREEKWNLKTVGLELLDQLDQKKLCGASVGIQKQTLES